MVFRIFSEENRCAAKTLKIRKFFPLVPGLRQFLTKNSERTTQIKEN